MKTSSGVLAIVLLAACGGQTSGPGGPGGGSGSSSGSSSSGSSGSGSGGSSGSSSGASGSSSGAGFGCPGNFQTTPSPVDPNKCAAQLSSTTSCAGQACSWTVEVPCEGDAGANDAGTDPCVWCNAAAPADAGPPGVCQASPLDGGSGVSVRCGGCGV